MNTKLGRVLAPGTTQKNPNTFTPSHSDARAGRLRASVISANCSRVLAYLRCTTQDWITRAEQTTDAPARLGSDCNIPDTTSPKMATTAIKLQLLTSAGELYHSLSVMVSGQTTRLRREL